jgi:hypothetical protein
MVRPGGLFRSLLRERLERSQGAWDLGSFGRFQGDGGELVRTILATTAAALLSGTVGAQNPARTVPDLSWITGHWVDDSNGELSEETWVPPSGDCVSGMWRWVVGGKAKLYELLTITAEADGLVMRLRHFDRAGIGWEDKDHPLVLKLVRSGDGEAVFEGQGTKGFLRLTYKRVQPDTLTGVLERGRTEKDSEREEFRFRLKPF